MLDTSFVSRLLTTCKRRLLRVALPEGGDVRTINAAKILLDHDAASNITLLHCDTQSIASHRDLSRYMNLGRLQCIPINDPSLIEATDKILRANLQKKSKPIVNEILSKSARDSLFQAGTLLSNGNVDCAVGGAVATTSDVIRAALGTVGLAPGIKTVSGSFFMNRTTADREETYCYADAGVVIDPTAEQLADIAVSSCATWQRIMGTEPVVAFLSFSTKGSAKHPDADKMVYAWELFRSRCPDVISDGELQFDAAFVESVGQRKSPGSKVPGRANIFIFPDLGAGNIAYKITQRLGGFAAFGPILQGLAKPYSDLSRGATAEDIVVSVLINCLRA